jgi:hypothetical protein
MLRFIPHAPLPSYPDRGHDDPAPVYSARLVAEMQSTLAAMADIAVQQEIERQHSNGDEAPPLSDAA